MSQIVTPLVVHTGEKGARYVAPNHVALVDEDGDAVSTFKVTAGAISDLGFALKAEVPAVAPLEERPESLDSVADIVAVLERAGIVPTA